MSPPNVYYSTFTYDENDPQSYRCGSALIGATAGGKALSVKLPATRPTPRC